MGKTHRFDKDINLKSKKRKRNRSKTKAELHKMVGLTNRRDDGRRPNMKQLDVAFYMGKDSLYE